MDLELSRRMPREEGEPFSWHIFHGSNVRVVERRGHDQRLWYVPPALLWYNPLVMVEPPLVTTATEQARGTGDSH